MTYLDSAEFAPLAALLGAWAAAPEPETPKREIPEPDTLRAIAQRLGVNERVLARRFANWAGVSAADFRSQLRAHRIEAASTAQRDVLQRTAYSLTLNGTGVLASKIAQVEAYKAATSLHRHAIRTPFGTAELTLDVEGRLWGLKFLDGAAGAIEPAKRSAFRADEWAERLFTPEGGEPLRLVLDGTPFQREVWRALLARDTQGCTDYGTLAKAIGRRNSQRAVGTAVGANPVGWLIPCHHVLRADGSLGGFRWGIARKRAMLVWESLPPPA